MTALPSFVELMASLGLDNNTDQTDNKSLPHHSRSSSYSSTTSAASHSSSNVSTPQPAHYTNESPSIVISRHQSSSASPAGRDYDLERRRHRTRFSPYSPPISHARRGSMPVMLHDEEHHEQPPRALSTSPCPVLPSRTVGRRSSALGLSASRRPEKLTLGNADFMANTPISTFVRRKTPQSSPISPTFPHRAKKRSTSPSAPVSIPTLPAFVFPPSSTSYGSPSSDTEDDDMHATLTPNYHLEPPHGNLSVRKLRSARRSDSDISLRRSPGLENPYRRRTSPVA